MNESIKGILHQYEAWKDTLLAKQIKKAAAFLVHALIVALFIFGANWGLSYSVTEAETIAVQWIDTSTIRLMKPPDTLFKGFKASPQIKTRLLNQVATLSTNAEQHFKILKYYYSRYYMSICLVMVFTLLAAISLLFIVQGGWMGTNQFVRTVFIASTAGGAFFGGFPAVFQQKQNIADNKKLYFQYVALNNEAVSYLTTGEDVSSRVVSPQEYIHRLDKQIAEINTFAIGFDDSKIPNFKTSFTIEDASTAPRK